MQQCWLGAQHVYTMLQVLQAEADDAAGKAISQYMYRAFNDIGDVPTADSNPLVRRNNLSKTNPLL